MRNTAWMLAGVLAALPLTPVAAADGDGLRPTPAQIPWARWQGRLSLGTASEPWRLGVEGPAVKLGSASLMGDYYFGRELTGPTRAGGLRATSGLVFGPRSAPSIGQPALASGSAFSIGNRAFSRPGLPATAELASDNATVPYLGIGYTGLAPRSGWGFSADLGLIAKTARFGAGPTLDDLVRDLRMRPIVQLGASYTF